MDRIKEQHGRFPKKIERIQGKDTAETSLVKGAKKELVERLKMLKRKTIDKVLPTGDSIEEINIMSKIAGALFQGDMVLSKEQQEQITADVLGTRSKRQTMCPGSSVFKKAAQQWMSDTCINFIPSQIR
ncbi:hypothetical protein OSTOST_06666 [Ostertagia ostertagi]